MTMARKGLLAGPGNVRSIAAANGWLRAVCVSVGSWLCSLTRPCSPTGVTAFMVLPGLPMIIGTVPTPSTGWCKISGRTPGQKVYDTLRVTGCKL